MSITVKQAVNDFLLSCEVEGKSYGTIKCYFDKLKGFLWYATNYDWHDDIGAITTQHIREFLAYLRETEHCFDSNCPGAKKVSQFTTMQKYITGALSLLSVCHISA
ncbi:phage integrase N-terminal SAM-like domain-containing protein [Chloroflexota bacterium]